MKSTRCYPSRNQTSALFDAEDTSAESWLGVNCCLGARGALFVAVLMLLICTGSATSAAQSPPPASFVTAKMFQVGTGYGNPIAYYGTAPYDLAVGDFNNDGNLDIIAACWSAEVTVNLGNGDGTFQSLNHVYALPGAQGVAVGDFNGDGNLDAAVLAVGNPGSVIIFLGDGTGNLTQGASYPVGNQGAGTSNIAVGKLHVGGNLDLVVTNGSDNTVSVLLGNGDGTFQPQETYAVGDGPQSVAVASLIAGGSPDLIVPGIHLDFDLGWWYVPIAAFIIVGASNAVNFTDGLDGLAGLISATAFAAYAMIALNQHQVYLARFCFTLVGALFGFLWFNVHPAELFMGDAGSLSLGATMAVVALMTGQWAVLPIIAIIPVSELISVVIQIAYFRLTKGKRFFKMAPIHLHFELLGWSETQVVQRFWLIGLLAAMVGVGLALV